MKVATLYSNFKNKGGAQNIALSIAYGLSKDGELPIILTGTPIELIHEDYKSRARFLPLNYSSILRLKKLGYKFISHDRKTTTKIMLWDCLCINRLKIVHVSHSTFNSLRSVTLYPKHIISISSGVTDNLKSYFKISSDRIKFIPNGLADWGKMENNERDFIKILFVGRICKVKRQLEVAQYLKGRLPRNVFLSFAGAGDDADALSELIKGEPNISYIGEINLKEYISDYDYVMLFSEKEGLPLTLIEACMSGKPMLSNRLLSVLDINEDKMTGFTYSSLSDLITDLPNLPTPGTVEYKRLSENARAKYVNCFSLEKMINAYSQILESL